MPRLSKAKTKAKPIPQPRGGKRKGAGRPKSTTTLERERDVKAVVLSQPHRKGNDLQWLAEPVGRILANSGTLTHKISRSALYESANRFAEAYSAWQGVVSSSRPFANSTAGTDGDMPEDHARYFEGRWMRAWRVLRAQGEMIEKSVFYSVIDPQPEDWRPPHWVCFGCIEGLKALASHFGIDIAEEDRLHAA